MARQGNGSLDPAQNRSGALDAASRRLGTWRATTWGTAMRTTDNHLADQFLNG